MKDEKPAPKSLFGIFQQAASQWSEDNALRLSAALAYYSIFSIAPLLVIAIAIAGWVFGHDAAQGLLDGQLRSLLGEKAAQGVTGMVQSASKPSSSLLAGIMGIVTLLLGASGVFGQLKDALNTIWEVKAKPGLGIANYLRERLLSFGMVLVIGFLLLVSLLLTTVLSTFSKYCGSAFPLSASLATVFGFLVSFAVITVLFAAIFKFLPDAKVRWHEVWIGAAVTGLLFEIGKSLLGLYLGRESTASAYGAAASAVLLLLWVYYASLILLFGAEFTQVYARAKGSRIEPSANAEPVTSEARAQQGLDSDSSGHGESFPHLAKEPARESPRLVLGITTRTPEVVSEPPSPVWKFALENPLGTILGAIGGGLAAGLALRRFEQAPMLSPAEQVKQGSRTLAIAGATAAATYLARTISRTKSSLRPLQHRGLETAKRAQEFVHTKIEQLERLV